MYQYSEVFIKEPAFEYLHEQNCINFSPGRDALIGTLQYLKSLATHLFIQQFVQASKQENTKALYYCPLVRRIHWCIPSCNKGLFMQKMFPCHDVPGKMSSKESCKFWHKPQFHNMKRMFFYWLFTLINKICRSLIMTCFHVTQY